MERPEVESENQNKSQQEDYKGYKRPEFLETNTIFLVTALKLKLRIQVKLINIVLLASKFSKTTAS